MKTVVVDCGIVAACRVCAGATLAAALVILPCEFARADLWIADPATEGEFGVGENWLSGEVPLDVPATIDNGGVATMSDGDNFVVSRLEVGLTTTGNRIVQSGGEMVSTGPIMIGFGAGSSGSYTATGGQIFTGGTAATDNTSIGRSGGTGTMDLSGGTVMSVTSGEFFVGQGSGSQGTLTLTDAEISATSWIAIGRGGGTGMTILNGASKLHTAGGGFVVGAPVGGVSTGALEIRGTSEAYYEGGNAILIGEAANGTVTVNGSGNFRSESSGIWVGQGSGGTGTLNLTESATSSANNETYIGNDGGSGFLNMSGDAMFSTPSQKLVISRTNGTGTVVVEGNAIMSIGGGEIVVAENATGSLTIGGNAQVIAAGSGMNVYVGSAPFSEGSLTPANGTLTMNGGSLVAETGEVVVALQSVGTGHIQANGGVIKANAVRKGAGAGTINFNGGGVQSTIASSDYFVGFGAADISVQGGGMKFDTNDNPVTITQALNGVGGLTKLGTGTLTLAGANTMQGLSTVQAGTLLVAPGGSLAGWLAVNAGATLSLGSETSLDDQIVLDLVNGANVFLGFTETETIGALLLNGEAQAIGQYTVEELNALGGGVTFTGEVGAMLNVTAVPEPTVMALLLAACAVAGIQHRRRR